MKLVIIEGVAKQETVKKYLGADYQVVATKGHIIDLPSNSLAVDVKNNFKPQYEVMKDKQQIVKSLKEKAKKADKVYLATDPDREGEAISWHLCNVLDIDEKSPVRIVFNEISKNAITKSLEHPRGIDRNLVDAYQARRVLDRLVGYKISPILCRKIQPKLSAGRVQSATLKLIVDREKEIRAFKPEEYWTLQSILAKKDNKSSSFVSALQKISGKKANIKSKESMDVVLSELSDKYIVKAIKKSVTKSHAAAPFTTSSMQQEAINKLGMNIKRVSETAQQLYEGVSLGAEGKVALVTYIRTDSVRVSPDAIAMAKSYITEKFGAKYLPKTPNFYKSKASAQDAHEAIRPISLDRTPESVKDLISNDCYRLYRLIYNKFLASQMTEALYDSVSIDIENGKYLFKATGKTLTFEGFLAAYKMDKVAKKTDKEEEENLEENDLIPELKEGEEVICQKLNPQQKFTKAPARFTEASLVKEMEEKGIGRPATYTQTITRLANRTYTERDGKTLVPTELGFKVCELLEKYFYDIVDVQFTASMEDKLDQISDEATTWQDIISKFYHYLEKKLIAATGDSEKFKIPPKETDVKCDKCGSPMVIRNGRYGEFMACSNYPACKNIHNMSKEVAKCPKCGGSAIERKSKKGKTFYGCSNYPKCNFISWEVPVEEKCPECNEYMTKKNVYGNTRIKCSACNYSRTEKSSKKEEDNQE